MSRSNRRAMTSHAELRGRAEAKLQSHGWVLMTDAALLIGVHYHTLREWVRLGKVTPLYIGKRAHFTATEIATGRALVRAQSAQSAQSKGDTDD